jgi:basic amino acid/polyamine antiporter, APA family
VAKKITGLSRVLGAGPIASVAYGEIGCSIYIALGIVALYALGLTPWVLLGVGLLFMLVALSYAEGTAALPEPGGGATFVRRAFNDVAGFVTGWALFLDYLIVIALAALFVPHYVGTAVGWEAIQDEPWDVVAGIGVIIGLAIVRLFRRAQLYQAAVFIAVLAFVSHLILIVLGAVLLLSAEGLGSGMELGTAPTWYALFFSVALATLAYTGLETVANLAAEAREPGRTLPRSLFVGIGAVVAVSVAIAAIGISAYPAHADPSGPGGYASDLGTAWIHAPIVGIAEAFGNDLPVWAVDALSMFLGVTGAIILVATVSTSLSGSGRLAYSMGQRAMLPRAFGRLNPRTLIAPASIATGAAVAIALLIAGTFAGSEVRFLASLYSFGALFAFTAAQLAVIRLRFTEPDLARPFRVPGNVRVRGVPVPLAALVGVPLTFALWIAALATHDAARIAGPAWLVAGLMLFVAVRRAEHEPLTEHVEPAKADLVPEVEGVYESILVPVKLGPIGEEMLATAIRLAEERGCAVRALHVIRIPLDLPMDAELADEEKRAEASLADAKLLASEHGVEIEGEVIRARSIGEAIVERASQNGVDLILMGSAPRWRRQSRFFSPTVDYVLRKAPSEVMVVTYPQGVLEDYSSSE